MNFNQKKISALVFSIFLACSVFSYDFTLSAIKTDNNTVEIYKGQSIQTVSSEHFLISMLATKTKQGIQFATSITNSSENDYFFYEDSISVYQGVYENNEWQQIPYVPASVYLENQRTQANTEEVLSAIALGLSAASAGYSTVNGTTYANGRTYSYSARVYNPVEATNARINSCIALNNLHNSNQDYLTFLEQNLLFSSQIPASANYSGIFIVKEAKGPDYKVVIEMDTNEELTFYFTRSDKAEILHPWKDKTHARNSFIFGLSPKLNHYSAYYLFSSPKSVGLYTGLTYQNDSRKLNYFGNLYTSDFATPSAYELNYPDPLNTGLSSYYDWQFKYDEKSLKYDSFGVFAGLSVKTFPYTWLLLGVGADFALQQFYEGDLYYSYPGDYQTPATEYTFYKHGYLMGSPFTVFVAPQVGLNFILNHLSLGCMATFPIGGNFSIDISLGLAI